MRREQRIEKVVNNFLGEFIKEIQSPDNLAVSHAIEEYRLFLRKAYTQGLNTGAQMRVAITKTTSKLVKEDSAISV